MIVLTKFQCLEAFLSAAYNSECACKKLCLNLHEAAIDSSPPENELLLGFMGFALSGSFTASLLTCLKEKKYKP